ncbi:MAG: YicC/YloC family endoribonuclease [Pseudomonadota bacterium]
MPHSMTAFARVEFSQPWGNGTWELRSVNHRYLEPHFRLPENFRGLETAIRDRLAARVKRGKIDCNLKIDLVSTAEGGITVNQNLAKDIARAASELGSTLETLAPINPIDVLRWPGVVESQKIDASQAEQVILEHLDAALDSLIETRAREGATLTTLLLGKCDAMGPQVEKLQEVVPAIIANLTERHQQRIIELASDIDAGRVEQESALLVQKLDVAEELDRLTAHIEEVRRVLASKEPIGRRLDFLMQELNREANTLASKSAHLETTNAAVELKVLIEQMREQVQNLE